MASMFANFRNHAAEYAETPQLSELRACEATARAASACVDVVQQLAAIRTHGGFERFERCLTIPPKAPPCAAGLLRSVQIDVDTKVCEAILAMGVALGVLRTDADVKRCWDSVAWRQYALRLDS